MGDKPVVIGFFGAFSAAATAAQPAFEAFAAEETEHRVLLVDVGVVKGAHKAFGVTTVPTVILAKGTEVLRQVVGPQTPDYYRKALFFTGIARAAAAGEAPQKRVTLYVSSSCPWCTRARDYLKRRQVRFSEINVSLDPNAATELQRKSGQTGVPQLDIGGQWVVGFNQPKINELLGLSAEG
ncbi:MAG: hypothetical protein JXX28_05255 [Deltaproteobacteria bacterium]|nr:hypothetical protein [Deltaproteobacteria bacterium]